MIDVLTRLFRDEEGQGLVEYALIIVLVSIGVIVALGAMTGKLNDIFDAIVEKLVIT